MKSTESIDGFNNFINKGNLVDLGFVGYKFIWSTRSFEGNLIRERTDRGLATIAWRGNYPEAHLLHLESNRSDHCPILLEFSPPYQRKNRRFKF